MNDTESDTLDSNQPIENPVEVTKKQRVLAARGQEVPIDLFLFSCLEQERLERAQAAAMPTIQWPALSNDAKDTFDPSNTFENLVQNLCQWYSDRFPELTSNRKVDHEQLVEVVPAFVAMCRDIADLFKLKADKELPTLPAEKAEDRTSWDAIEAAVRRFFSSNSHLFLRFLAWAYGREKVEEFVPGSRPPVGRYAPPLPPRNGRADTRPGRSDRPGSAKGRGDRGGKPDRSDHRPRHEKQSRPDRERDRDRGARPSQHGSQVDSRRKPRKNDEETAKLSEKAVAEAAEAISSMQKDTSLAEFTLKPTNSFYRRIQHQYVVDAGYVSNSVGEGADRAVQITRKH